MKSTEAIDESVESSGPVLAAAESAGAADPSMLDQRRRRLVRGAAAFAPLVLTLRSGALAAASCTGTKIAIADARTNSNGRIFEGTQPATGLIPINTNPTNPDYCVRQVNQCTTSPLKINTIDADDVIVPVYEKQVNGDTRFFCGGIPSTVNPVPDDFKNLAQNGNFAILSSASRNSLVPL